MDCLYLVTHLILYNLYKAIIPADHVKHDENFYTMVNAFRLALVKVPLYAYLTTTTRENNSAHSVTFG